jgi:beta-N-acetylhexosaminidase
MTVTHWATALAAAALTACSSTAGSPVSPSGPPTRPAPSSATTSSSPPPPPSPPPSSAAPTSTAPTRSLAQRVFDDMSEAERVGQLLMVDCPSGSVASATVTAIQAYHAGSVILDGNSQLSITQTRTITDELQSDAPAHVKLFVSTDQEGGLVRRMQGPGFDDIPSAVVQGTLSPSTLAADATRWGGQLHDAGINVDLAPVLDTVPANSAGNPPIGDLDREYGHDPGTVATHGVAVALGLAAAEVDATVKHFPGLGRVSGNTDTTSGVTDTVTTRTDPYLQPFKEAIQNHVPFVMMSTAIYARIDPGTPAAFSSTIVTGLLRGDLGFDGIVISDDLGAAKQVGGYSVGARAVDFVAAGGDIALTVVASQAQAMTAALLAKANADPAFKKQVDAAALRVLEAKQERGLLS